MNTLHKFAVLTLSAVLTVCLLALVLAGCGTAAAPGLSGEERGRGRRPAERPWGGHRAHPPGPLHPLCHDLFQGPGRPAAGDSRVTRRVCPFMRPV